MPSLHLNNQSTTKWSYLCKAGNETEDVVVAVGVGAVEPLQQIHHQIHVKGKISNVDDARVEFGNDVVKCALSNTRQGVIYKCMARKNEAQ